MGWHVGQRLCRSFRTDQWRWTKDLDNCASPCRNMRWNNLNPDKSLVQIHVPTSGTTTGHYYCSCANKRVAFRGLYERTASTRLRTIGIPTGERIWRCLPATHLGGGCALHVALWFIQLGLFKILSLVGVITAPALSPPRTNLRKQEID